ncbi:hypothetical protein BSKO_11850 [Bryopsis sp. KO-2023]|nr:hypothetical protein BSKO_11850 [Bryopsis sp. KO-2023]
MSTEVNLAQKPNWDPEKYRTFAPIIGKSKETVQPAPARDLNQLRAAKSWEDIKTHLESLQKLPHPHVLVVAFEMLEKMDPPPPHEFLNEVMVTVADIGADFPLDGLSDLLRSCARMGYVDMTAMEALARELRFSKDLAKVHTRDLTKFIMSLGMLYENRGGVMFVFPEEEELVEADDEYAGVLDKEKVDQSETDLDESESEATQSEGSRETSEVQLQAAESETQSRYLDSLTDLYLRNPNPVSTAEIDPTSLRSRALDNRPDPVQYDKEESDQEGENSDGSVKRNSQLELVRLLGGQLVSQRRHHIITVNEMYEGLYGLCLMRYKRDNVMKKLTQRLRLPQYYKKMSAQQLTNLMAGLSGIRFRHHRAMLKITTELIHPHRLKEITPSQATSLMRSMTDLDIRDQQFVTTLGLKKVLPSLDKLTGGEMVSALVGIMTGEIKDRPLLNGIAKGLLDVEKFGRMSVEDLADLLEALSTLDFRKDIHASLMKLSFSRLCDSETVGEFGVEHLGGVVRSLGNLKCEDRRVLDVVFGEVVKPERLESMSEEAFVSVMHGVARTDHGKDASFFTPLAAEGLKPGRLKKFHIREMSNLALSFGMVKGLLQGSDLETFWTEALKLERARRYLPGMMSDLLEGARKLRVKNMDVYADLAYRLTQKHRIEFMTLAQFVKVIETLGKLRVSDAIKDELALKKLFYEFVRPSKAKYLTTDGLPTIMQAILDLRYSERRRVLFLAMQVRHNPRHVALWSDQQLQVVWRGFRSYDCDDQEAIRLVKKEMLYRGLPLVRKPPYV